MLKYGILLGRFQPFHIGHEAIVHEIISDGFEPLILLGSALTDKDDRNPYNVMERVNMVNLVFSGLVKVAPIPDFDKNEYWLECIESVLKSQGLDKSSTVWYINNKEEDRYSFTFNGKEYKNSFYTEMLTDSGFIVKEVQYPSKLNISISASNIRDNLEEYKHYLDSRVYLYIKGLNNATRLSSNKKQ